MVVLFIIAAWNVDKFGMVGSHIRWKSWHLAQDHLCTGERLYGDNRDWTVAYGEDAILNAKY